MSIRYLVPEPVVEYIEDNNLYEEDGSNATPDKGKQAASSSAAAPGETKGVAPPAEGQASNSKTGG